MRKLLALCALALTACAPGALASSISPNAGDSADAATQAIPVTYFPTVTPFPTWTPIPAPTQTLGPSSTATSQPPAATEVMAPVPPLSELPVQPAAPATPELVPLPTPEPTAIPALLVDSPAPTPIPVIPVVEAQRSAAFAAPASSGCPAGSSSSFDLVPIEGSPYKGNALTDENPDLRLSVLGYTQSSAPLTLVEYNGATDPDAPKLHGTFEPNRIPTIVGGYQRLNWLWNESGAPPYGAAGGTNDEWPASVIELGAAAGEPIHIPERNAAIYSGGVVALVLYADERELTLAYTRQDSVSAGYVVHLLNFCTDSNLVAQYRAQTNGGRRATGHLPGVRVNQLIGTAVGSAITVAIRDRGTFLDPRSRKDWW